MDTGGGGIGTYVVSLPRVLSPLDFILEVRQVRTHPPDRLREYFMYRHRKAQVAILQEDPSVENINPPA